MKGLFKNIIVAGVSFAAGYVTCRQIQESYYLEVANRKLEEQDEHHAANVKELETQIGELQNLLADRQLDVITVIAQSETPPEQEDDGPTLEELEKVGLALTSYQGEPVRQLVDYTKFSGQTAASNVVTTESPRTPKHGDPLLPRLIEEQQFIESEISFVFTLYVGDNTLTDERDEPISAADRTSILGHLDGGLVPHVNHENNVFVYNPEGNYAVQICVSMGSYSSEVGG